MTAIKVQGSRPAGVSPIGVVEPLNQWQKQAVNRFGAANPYNDKVERMLGGAAYTFNAQPYIDSSRQSFTGDNVDQYMNPYIQQVVDRSVDAIRRNTANQMSGANSAATQAGAFGSTRDAVMRSKILEGENRQVGDTSAGLYAQGYESGRNQFNTERGRDLQAAGTGMQNEQLRSSAELARANAMSGLADNYRQSTYDMMYGGDKVQQNNQALLDYMNQERLAQADYGKNQLNWYSDIVNAFPQAGGQVTQARPSTLQSALGGAMAGAGLYNSYQNSMPQVNTSYGPQLPANYVR